MLLVHYYAFASVDQFPFMDSVWYLGMLIVGGMGSIPGAILGAVSLKLLDELVTIFGPILSAAVAAQAAASLALIQQLPIPPHPESTPFENRERWGTRHPSELGWTQRPGHPPPFTRSVTRGKLQPPSRGPLPRNLGPSSKNQI